MDDVAKSSMAWIKHVLATKVISRYATAQNILCRFYGAYEFYIFGT